VYGELSKRDGLQKEGVILHRHLNKLVLRYRVGPLVSTPRLKIGFKITMGRTPASEEATVDAVMELELPANPPASAALSETLP
jgi:hypothetical protein